MCGCGCWCSVRGCWVRATITLLAGRSGTAFASPFLLYLLCSSTAVVAGGDIFHRAPCACECMCVFVYARLQLLFQRKFANDSPLSVLAFRLPHIARRFFFCPTLTGRASVRASRFLCPDPGVDKVYGHGWLAIDERRLQKNAVAGAPEGPSPRDSAEQRTHRRSEFLFPCSF